VKTLNYQRYHNTLIKFFTDSARDKAEVLLWQLNEDKSKREIHEAKLTHFDPKKSEFYFTKAALAEEFNYNETIIYVHFKKIGALLKVAPSHSDSSEVKTTAPDSVIFMNKVPEILTESPVEETKSDSDILEENMIYMTLDEEDKFYEDKREAPRARPNISKVVHILRQDNNQELFFDLFDLSRGGLSVLIPNDYVFSVGEKIAILGFNMDRFDNPISAEIMNMRSLDDTDRPDFYKMGMRFI
jgi:hypothetical protein